MTRISIPTVDGDWVWWPKEWAGYYLVERFSTSPHFHSISKRLKQEVLEARDAGRCVDFLGEVDLRKGNREDYLVFLGFLKDIIVGSIEADSKFFGREILDDGTFTFFVKNLHDKMEVCMNNKDYFDLFGYECAG